MNEHISNCETFGVKTNNQGSLEGSNIVNGERDANTSSTTKFLKTDSKQNLPIAFVVENSRQEFSCDKEIHS